MTLVLDVSRFAGIPDFRPLRDRGAEGLIVRASSGISDVDDIAAEQIAAGVAAGLTPIACYHYLRSWHDGATQAAHAVAVAARLGLPTCGDFEKVAKGERPTDAPHLARITALAFLRHHRSLTGRHAVSYGPAFYLRDLRLEGDDVGPLWVAHAEVEAPLIPPPWTSAVLWQYDLDEDVAPDPAWAKRTGAKGARVDWSRSDLTIEQLAAVFRGEHVAPPLSFEGLGPVVTAVRAAEGRGATVETFTSRDEGPDIG